MKSHTETHSSHVGFWQLQEAKNKLSQVVSSAKYEGPQTITLRGEPAVVVISIEEYRKMVGRPMTTLSDFFAQSPLCDVELDFARNNDLSREINL